MDKESVYLGDGVYIQPTNYGWLMTANEPGEKAALKIYLEPQVAHALARYLASKGVKAE